MKRFPLLTASCLSFLFLPGWKNGSHFLNKTNTSVSQPTSYFSTSEVSPGDSVIVLSNGNYILPFDEEEPSKIAVLSTGNNINAFIKGLNFYKKIENIPFQWIKSYEEAAALATKVRSNYDKIIITIAPDVATSANNPVLTPFESSLITQLQQEMRTLTVVFGNPLLLRGFTGSPSLVIALSDNTEQQEYVARLLFGKTEPVGKLKESVSEMLRQGAGLTSLKHHHAYLAAVNPQEIGIDQSVLYKVDSIAKSGIDKKAFPGCELIAMKDGKIFYHKSLGYLTYDKKIPVNNNIIYDMASVTKIAATTLATMRLYDEGKLRLEGTLGEYLPWLRRSDKASITIKDMLLHQAGFEPDFPYLDLMLTDRINPNPNIFHAVRDSIYSMRVAENMYMNKYYKDIMNMEIRSDLLQEHPKYVYSDIDLQLMGYIVEELTGMPLEKYVKETFYEPMGLTSTGFLPRQRYPLDQIAPVENEKLFRLQQLHGDVHDPRAAMWGGVQGHAGLFSNAYDMGVLMQMLLNNGSFDGVQYIKPSTVKLFTSYQSNISRRGIGFDKPLRQEDRKKVNYDYPAKFASAETFGHTGYTGTCVWADPQHNFVYVLLTNRVYPDGGDNRKIYDLGIQRKIMDVFYEAMISDK